MQHALERDALEVGLDVDHRLVVQVVVDVLQLLDLFKVDVVDGDPELREVDGAASSEPLFGDPERRGAAVIGSYDGGGPESREAPLGPEDFDLENAREFLIVR